MSQALDALIERALFYSDEVSLVTGVRPTTFPITEEEYGVLLRDCRWHEVPADCLPPRGEVYVAGMRVVVPEPFRVDRMLASRARGPSLTRLREWAELFAAQGSSAAAQGDPDDPLPPIEGLDEGLQCCHTHFETFAKYLAHHAQQHQVG